MTPIYFIWQMLRHSRDALLTWDSIAYWEHGTKDPGSEFQVRVAEGQL